MSFSDDPVLQEFDALLKQIFNETKEMPSIECAKRISSWSATFLEQFIIAKREHSRAKIARDKAEATAYHTLKYKSNFDYNATEARQQMILDPEVERTTREADKYELQVLFFEQALKATGNHTWTLNYLVKFYSTNRDELFS